MSMVPFRKREARQKRQTLDQAQVVRAALALLDQVGLDELTMRRLAGWLDVKAASLYRHVRSKEELLALLGDEISAEIPLPPASGNWRDQLSESAWNVRRGLLAHRDAARVLASTPPAGPRRLRHVEALLRILRAAGLKEQDAARAAYHFNNLVTEFAADEGRFASYAAAVPGSSRRKILAEVRRQFKSLPIDEYPTIVALADHLTADAQDELFQFGIDMCLRTVEALVKRK
ncbi:MAG TPA: TetR/AcrR family transcriptional regulator C-terminal domain-containing protein [Vicinamibacterales bacterium]|nr:TetR/AcrR family transcriptional regulator C-terminal domain-containing protein [Vicinamibacterales bacterium]